MSAWISSSIHLGGLALLLRIVTVSSVCSSGSDFSQLQAKHISLAAVVGLAGAGVAIVCGAWVLFWLHRYHRGTRNEATPDISDKSETSSIADRTFGPVPQAPAATPAGRAWSGFGGSRRASPCESHHTGIEFVFF